MALWFAFQSPLSPSHPLSWPPWGPPTCGYNSTRTPSMGTGPLWPGRWNTAQPVGAGVTGSQWTPRATKLGIWTPTRSMRSVCSSPGPGRAAPAPLGPPRTRTKCAGESGDPGAACPFLMGSDLQPQCRWLTLFSALLGPCLGTGGPFTCGQPPVDSDLKAWSHSGRLHPCFPCSSFTPS